MSRTFAICTTFNQQGYYLYAKTMIDGFEKNWPSAVNMHVFAEDCAVDTNTNNIIVHDLHTECPKLVNFKQKWKDVPKANGDISNIDKLSNRLDSKKSFKWDAIRFSNKVYTVIKSAELIDADALLWMDADMICHSPISYDQIEHLCPTDIDIAFFGRENKYSECGLYYLNLNSEKITHFLHMFENMYEDAENGIFRLSEWHDSYVFDYVRMYHDLRELNWSPGLIKGEGHPLVNSEWGKYLDHLKGSRKMFGKSLPKDLIITRTEDYWK